MCRRGTDKKSGAVSNRVERRAFLGWNRLAARGTDIFQVSSCFAPLLSVFIHVHPSDSHIERNLSMCIPQIATLSGNLSMCIPQIATLSGSSREM